MNRMLIINPGSTSTKISVFDNLMPLFEETIRHTNEELSPFKTIIEQFEFRKETIIKVMNEKGIDISTLTAVVGRGGLLKPISSGVYAVTENMLKDLRIGIQGQHASNLGGIIANEIAEEAKIKAYILDPVVVDELDDIARISGLPQCERRSIFHALNQKAVSKRYAKSKGVDYESLNLIVAHCGGGVSVGIHKQGLVVDVNNALNGEGPFSPERTGGLPIDAVAEMCFSGNYTKDEVFKMLSGKGGLVAYLGTNSCKEVEEMVANGDKKAELIFKAMAYQVAKEIGALSTVVNGKVDAIILTGGISYSEAYTSLVKEKIEFIAPVEIYAGEDEMLALAEGVYRVLQGEENLKEY